MGEHAAAEVLILYRVDLNLVFLLMSDVNFLTTLSEVRVRIPFGSRVYFRVSPNDCPVKVQTLRRVDLKYNEQFRTSNRNRDSPDRLMHYS
jgi:hypothetical protein